MCHVDAVLVVVVRREFEKRADQLYSVNMCTVKVGIYPLYIKDKSVTRLVFHYFTAS